MIYNDEGTRKYARYVFRKILQHVARKRLKVLNAGCGSNWMRKYAPPGITLVGLDINNPSADVNADLGKPLPFKAGEFDAIILVHVIEHLREPLFTLKEFRRILRKGGTVFISTPSPWSPNAWEDPYHLRPYTMGALRTLAADAGLEMVEAYYSNNAPGFGILHLNRFQGFYHWFTHRLRFLSALDYFKGNAEAILRK